MQVLTRQRVVLGASGASSHHLLLSPAVLHLPRPCELPCSRWKDRTVPILGEVETAIVGPVLPYGEVVIGACRLLRGREGAKPALQPTNVDLSTVRHLTSDPSIPVSYTH